MSLGPRLRALVTFLSSDVDVVTTFTLRRMFPGRFCLSQRQTRQGEILLAFVVLWFCATSLRPDKDRQTNEHKSKETTNEKSQAVTSRKSYASLVTSIYDGCLKLQNLSIFRYATKLYAHHGQVQEIIVFQHGLSKSNNDVLLFRTGQWQLWLQILITIDVNMAIWIHRNLLFVDSVPWYLFFPISESGFHVNQQVSRNDAVFSTKFIDDNSPQSHHKTLVLTQIGEFLAINGRIKLSV